MAMASYILNVGKKKFLLVQAFLSWILLDPSRNVYKSSPFVSPVVVFLWWLELAKSGIRRSNSSAIAEPMRKDNSTIIMTFWTSDSSYMANLKKTPSLKKVQKLLRRLEVPRYRLRWKWLWFCGTWCTFQTLLGNNKQVSKP